MPKICTFKPIRKKARVFTAKDVGRIICYAIADGASIQDIRNEAEECLGEQDECECDRLKQLLFNIGLLLELVGLALSLFAGLRLLRPVLIKARSALEKAGDKKATKELDDYINGEFKRVEEGTAALPQLTEAVIRARNELSLAARELFRRRGNDEIIIRD